MVKGAGRKHRKRGFENCTSTPFGHHQQWRWLFFFFLPPAPLPLSDGKKKNSFGFQGQFLYQSQFITWLRDGHMTQILTSTVSHDPSPRYGNWSRDGCLAQNSSKNLQEKFLSPSKIASAKILACLWLSLSFYEDRLRMGSTAGKPVYRGTEKVTGS